jgi:hypothetical protein
MRLAKPPLEGWLPSIYIKKIIIFALFIYIFIRFYIFFIVMDTCRLPIECGMAD